ncbi:MAG: glycosyltransferase [Lachnospiraceae bacterium]|nr:glycosyltransferase [Lachnospiraceae bacterium]
MIRLQSILLPTKEVCDVSELYYHRDGHRIDYNGYFNLFYLEKWNKYTNIERLTLHIQCLGYQKLVIVHDGQDVQQEELNSTQLQEYQIEFPYGVYDTGCFWFALIEDEAAKQRSLDGYLEATLPADRKQNPVHIGIDICTYRRETYVTRNIRQLRDKILLNPNIEAANHVRVYLIDNGQTLQGCEAFEQLRKTCEEKVVVVPNMNAGGAGGFTRGMIEVLKYKGNKTFTHVLLMDDDAVLEPDTIVRIYGFLSVVKDEWKDITIGGAMLREDYPHRLFCAGEIWENGKIINPRVHLDLRKLSEATSAYLTETGHEHEWYSGWWCCCYSLNTVRADNLPIPLFFHHDDIEFGLRNKDKGIVFLNGVSVWHRGAELTFPGSNIYYDVRNNLMEIALHQETGNTKRLAKKLVIKSLLVALIRLKYKEALIVYKGFEDFLKGTEWLASQQPDILNQEIRAMAYQMKPLEAWEEYLTKEEYESVEAQIQERKQTFGEAELLQRRVEKTKATFLHYITLNGWLLPAERHAIKVSFSPDSPFENFRQSKVLLYEPGSERTLLLKKHYKDFAKIGLLIMKAFVSLERNFKTAERDYRTNICKLTNQKSWEKYLEL